MANKKYINTSDIVEQTGHTPEEIRRLANTGVLPAHKTRRGYFCVCLWVVEKKQERTLSLISIFTRFVYDADAV